MVKERNINLDIIRGIAAYSVVANHVLSHFEGYGDSMIGNINFSLQNPLFMMVSGWALMYSKPIIDMSSFISFIKKRTLLLIIPWLIWSILKFLILGNKGFVTYFQYDLFHMEGMYWFLFSLWVMNIIYAFSCLLFKRIIDKRIKYCIFVSFISLVIIGLIFIANYCTIGVDFLGTKFTTYYFPFFLLGWFGSEIYKKKWNEMSVKYFDWTVFLCVVLYAIFISKFDIASLPDSMAPLRLFISLSGCVVIFYVIFKNCFNPANKLVKAFSWGGMKTLEIYVVHYIVMGFLKNSGNSVLNVIGFTEFIINLSLVLGVTVLFIMILDSNQYSKKVLFGKF